MEELGEDKRDKYKFSAAIGHRNESERIFQELENGEIKKYGQQYTNEMINMLKYHILALKDLISEKEDLEDLKYLQKKYNKYIKGTSLGIFNLFKKIF